VQRELDKRMLEWARRQTGFSRVLVTRVRCLSWLQGAEGLRALPAGAQADWRLCLEDPVVRLGRDGQPEAQMVSSSRSHAWVSVLDLLALNNIGWKWQGPALADTGCAVLNARWAPALEALAQGAKALPPVKRKKTVWRKI
jgi:hypothetical protein